MIMYVKHNAMHLIFFVSRLIYCIKINEIKAIKSIKIVMLKRLLHLRQHLLVPVVCRSYQIFINNIPIVCMYNNMSSIILHLSVVSNEFNVTRIEFQFP